MPNDQEFFGLLVLLCAVGSIVLLMWVVLREAKKGAFHSTKWFELNGIPVYPEHTVVASVRIDGNAWGVLPHLVYTLHATASDSETGEQQHFSQVLKKREKHLFDGGGVVIVYLHPKKPKVAYRIVVGCEGTR